MADTESQERFDQQIAHLERQLEYEVSKSDRYQNQLGALQVSFRCVSRALGCTTPDELENLVSEDKTTWNRTNIEYNAKRVPTLKEEVKAVKESVAGLERESEARVMRLNAQEETVKLLREQLSQTQAERDALNADLIAARNALTTRQKALDDAHDEIRAVRLSHDNMKTKHLSLRTRHQGERARRLSEMKRLCKASKTSKDALYQAAMRIVFAFENRPRSADSDEEVKVEATDSDSVFPSPATIGRDKIRAVSAHETDSSPALVVFGTSSIPNTPTKTRRIVAAEATSDTHATGVAVYGPGPSFRPNGATFVVDASDTPSSYTLEGTSTKPSPVRRPPRKLTPQKRKRSLDENVDGQDKHAPPSPPRSDVSATQDETQAPHFRFTPTKRAQRTADLPTSLPRPLDALIFPESRSPPSSTTSASRAVRLDPVSLPSPPRAALASGNPFPRTRPATSPRRLANTKRTTLFSLGSPEKPMFSPKILRTYSKQIKRPITRGPDTTFEEKRARKRGRYSAPELSTTKPQPEEEEEIDDSALKVFPYEEVVRGKRRKELDAEDCEECREYYNAVGPMPPRLQAPLWRSPSSSPQHHRHVHHHHHYHHPTEPAPVASSSKRSNEKIETTRPHGDEHYDADFDDAFFNYQSEVQRGKHVDRHRQEISRHRAMFARPKTPPGFWDINFPDTPKVDALNKEAHELRIKKEGKDHRR